MEESLIEKLARVNEDGHLAWRLVPGDPEYVTQVDVGGGRSQLAEPAAEHVGVVTEPQGSLPINAAQAVLVLFQVTFRHVAASLLR